MTDKKKIAVLTGAGVSAESGFATFRDSGGLWEQYDVYDVASIEGWYRNRPLVLDFYNERRAQLKDAKPNAAHLAIAALEKDYHVDVITQNVDNLHERAGSTRVLHLHGELTKVRPENSLNSGVRDIGYRDINLGDTDGHGVQLRPHIVWFGEAVPELERAARAVSQADILLIIGTSLNVYPAAGLYQYLKVGNPIYLVDPKPISIPYRYFRQIQEPATSWIHTL